MYKSSALIWSERGGQTRVMLSHYFTDLFVHRIEDEMRDNVFSSFIVCLHMSDSLIRVVRKEL